MSAFLIGWGVFWLLLWLAVFALGLAMYADANAKFCDAGQKFATLGMIGTVISGVYLVAVFAGRALS